MTKGTKITIGILSTLAVGGFITWLVVKNRKPKEALKWEEADVEGGVNKDGAGGTTKTPISAEQRQDNNFKSVRDYFGQKATNYGDRIVIKTDGISLEKAAGWVKNVRQDNGTMKMTRTKPLGLDNTDILLVYWEDGQFTVKIGNTKAVIQGYYYNGGTIIKVTKGKGQFASKAGIREMDNERLIAIARVFQR
jgi:hypothetical protein